MKRLRIIIFWGSLYLLSQYNAYLMYADITNINEVNECGVLIDKSRPDDLHVGKHNARVTIKNSFVVKFDNLGIIDMDVTADTYYNNKVGDRVCFGFDEPRSAWFVFTIILGGLGFMLDFMVIIMIIIPWLYNLIILGKNDNILDYLPYD